MDVGVSKPAAAPFLSACERSGFEPLDVVMIGDNPRDDIAGAKAALIPIL